MKINDDHINRLLKGAQTSQAADNLDLSFATQSRILSNWKSGADVASLDLLRVFQFGLGCACALVLLVASVSLRELYRKPLPSVAVQEEVINLAFTK